MTQGVFDEFKRGRTNYELLFKNAGTNPTVGESLNKRLQERSKKLTEEEKELYNNSRAELEFHLYRTNEKLKESKHFPLKLIQVDDIKMRRDIMKLQQFERSQHAVEDILKNDKTLHEHVLPNNTNQKVPFPREYMVAFKDFASWNAKQMKKCETEAEAGNYCCLDLLHETIALALADGDYGPIGEPLKSPFQM